jgi:hypothetical protein
VLQHGVSGTPCAAAEHGHHDMRWIALPLLFILSAGPAMHWGDVDAGLQAALLWSVGIGMFAVLAGWRAAKKGRFTSTLRWIWLAGIVNVPAYFVGRWLATMPADLLQPGCSWLDTALGPAIKQLACGG